MTTGIALIVPTAEAQIVTVSDARLSYGDILPATDDAVLKNARIGSTWGMMFAAQDSTVFSPVLERVRNSLGFGEGNTSIRYDHFQVQKAVQSAYEHEHEERFFREHLAKLKYDSISEFRRDGRNELGDEIYGDYIFKLANFDIGLELLVYGFGSDGRAHIFEVENPSKLSDHSLLHYAAIGSGSTMAYAALNRKKLTPGLEEVVYRALDAKFASETARDVGRKTHLLIMNRNARFDMLRKDEIKSIREMWDKIMNQPEPQEPIDAIENFGAIKRMSEAE